MRAIFSSLACSFLYAFLRILFVSTYAHTSTSFLIKSYFLSRLVVRLNSFSCAAAAVLVPWIPWCSPFFFCTAAFCAAFSFVSVHFFYFKHAFRPHLFNVRLLAYKPNHSLSLSLENWGLLQFIFLAVFQYVSSVHSRSIFCHWLLGRPRKLLFLSIWFFYKFGPLFYMFRLFRRSIFFRLFLFLWYHNPKPRNVLTRSSIQETSCKNGRMNGRTKKNISRE